MDVYKTDRIEDLIRGNSYVGRGIVIGKSEDGKKACAAYFLRNRPYSSEKLSM